MDGLLIDSEPLWQLTHKEIYGGLGIDLNDEDRAAMIGARTNENIDYLYSKYGDKQLSKPELEDRIINRMIEYVRSDGALLPGVHHVLSICKRAGLPIAIASSSPQALINAVVDVLEIREHFHHIYSAQYEKYGKPHPGVFISVAEHLKVDPRDCLVFEDSPSGVLAAKSAKMKCVAVPEEAYKENKFIRAADVILDSLEDFDKTTLLAL